MAAGAAFPVLIALLRLPFRLLTSGHATDGWATALLIGPAAGAVGGLGYTLVGQHVRNRWNGGWALAGISCSIPFFAVLVTLDSFTANPLRIPIAFWGAYALLMGVALGFGMKRPPGDEER